MIRLLAEFLLPLLAPTIAYAIWRALPRRGAAPGEGDGAGAPAATPWREAPWIWLGGTGIRPFATPSWSASSRVRPARC